MSFITADDPGATWKDPDSLTPEQVEQLIAAYLEARAVIARLEAEITRLNGEQEVYE
jgi:hypothetical protein